MSSIIRSYRVDILLIIMMRLSLIFSNSNSVRDKYSTFQGQQMYFKTKPESQKHQSSQITQNLKRRRLSNCPTNTFSNIDKSQCYCNYGYSGKVTKNGGSFQSTCEPVKCPENSTGSGVGKNCICNTGYSGHFQFLSGKHGEVALKSNMLDDGTTVATYELCLRLPCPPLTKGEGGGAPCACEAGLRGTVTFDSELNSYSSINCVELKCPEHAIGRGTGNLCECGPGFSGTIIYNSTTMKYDGECSQDVAGNLQFGFLFLTLSFLCILYNLLCFIWQNKAGFCLKQNRRRKKVSDRLPKQRNNNRNNKNNKKGKAKLYSITPVAAEDSEQAEVVSPSELARSTFKEESTTDFFNTSEKKNSSDDILTVVDL